ncbi:MAG TPA: hypothetical protein VET23_14145 [Chitinophagaceae bacterium]|nr:hypothetical protein [Chitinophagaceae bacterium]
MKQKIFYLLALICCINIFSSANETRKACNSEFYCPLSLPVIKSSKKVNPVNAGGLGFDLSPLQLFVFNI